MKPLNTITIVEIFEGQISTHSYPNSPEGIEAAERVFTKIARENEFENDEIESALENRDCLDRYENGEDYSLYFIYSQTE